MLVSDLVRMLGQYDAALVEQAISQFIKTSPKFTGGVAGILKIIHELQPAPSRPAFREEKRGELSSEEILRRAGVIKVARERANWRPYGSETAPTQAYDDLSDLKRPLTEAECESLLRCTKAEVA